MANILLAWELGGGLGHLSALRPMVTGLAEKGHRVFAALRDLSRADRMFGAVEVSFLQAPFRSRRGRQYAQAAQRFAARNADVPSQQVERMLTRVGELLA